MTQQKPLAKDGRKKWTWCPVKHKFQGEVQYGPNRDSYKCPVCDAWWSMDEYGRWLKNGYLYRSETRPKFKLPPETGIA